MSVITKWINKARLRIILIGMLIPAIPLLTLATIFYFTLTDNIGELLTEKVDMVVTSAEERIETSLARDIAVAQMFATRQHMLSMIEQGDLEQMNMHLMHLVENQEHVDRATIVNTKGIQIANYPFTPETIGLDLSHRDYFLGVTKNWTPYISEFFLRAGEPRRYVFTISVPILKNGIPLGLINIQPKAEYFNMMLEGITIPDGHIVVVDSRGFLVYSSLKEDILTEPEDISGWDVVQRLMRGEEGFEETLDAETDEMVFTSYRAIGEHGWGIIVDIPTRIAMDPLIDVLNLILGITFFLLLVGSFVGYRFALMLETEKENSIKLHEQTTELTIKNDQLAQINEEIKTLNKELTVASTAKSNFLANVSHELRTPMNSIIGFSQILEDGFAGALTEKQREYVNHINSSGTHLLSLINEILDLSKVEAGKMVLDLNRFPLKEVLYDAKTQFVERCRIQNIQMDVEIDPKADIELEADEKRFLQIILNLLSNAVKFTPDGGVVKVIADISKREEIRLPIPEDISTLTHSEYIKIAVSDTGIGIKHEDQSRLFKPFSQLESTYTKKYEGTGLGLALIKKLIELHDGKIWVDSEYGKGSTFTFVLPLL